MTPSPDPLFRNGLENYRKAAPASVWDRVEAGLERKRRKNLWFRIAAGLFLLLATSTLLWQYSVGSQQSAVGSQKLAVNSIQSAVDSQQFSVDSQQSAVGILQSSQLNSIVERSRNNHSDAVHENLPVVVRSRNEHLKSSLQSAVGSKQSSVGSHQLIAGSTKSVITLDEEQLITLTEPEDITAELTPINSSVGSGNDVIIEQKGTSITYTADQVNSRFIKKEKVLEATPAKKNTSGLQKVIDKALDLTNEGTVYGELREKKNEWLSFNMLSNKTEANK